jgi:hypothetical protein
VVLNTDWSKELVDTVDEPVVKNATMSKHTSNTKRNCSVDNDSACSVFQKESKQTMLMRQKRRYTDRSVANNAVGLLSSTIHADLVLQCLAHYKQTYGHINVRRNWKIPAEASWPQSLHKKSLASIVSSLRRSALQSGDNTLLQRLACLGVLPGKAEQSENHHNIEVIVKALQRYKSIYGDLQVPQKFVCPIEDPDWPNECWGLPLGQRVKKIQCRESFSDEYCVNKLKSIGFKWKPRLDRRGWVSVYSALKLYREAFGDLCVPFSWVVPSDDDFWPLELHGLKLGARVSDIRCGRIYTCKYKELNALGFIWNAASLSFERFYRGLKLFRRVYGHLVVPPNFVFPSSKLASKFIDIDTNRKSIEPVMGFILTYSSGEDTSSSIPQELEGFPLGRRVRGFRNKYRSGNMHQSMIDRLDEIGFVWGKEIATSAIEVTKCDIQMNVLTSRKLCLKDESNTTDTTLKYREDNDSTFTIERDNRGFDHVVSALYVYRDLFGDVRVPSRWIVPCEAPWPQDTWGLALGRRVSAMRYGRAYTNLKCKSGKDILNRYRKEILNDLGFDWEVQRDSRGFAHVYQALSLYKTLNGHLDVPREFTVPSPNSDGESRISDDDTVSCDGEGSFRSLWPRVLWGMKLGRTVYDINRRAAYTKTKQTTLLQELGFDLTDAITFDMNREDH